MTRTTRSSSTMAMHLDATRRALDALFLPDVERAARELVDAIRDGGRVLVAGNGGSAAHAQHLSAELVGRYVDKCRAPCSAIALHSETSSLTAVANDFGWNDVFSRQVQAHGRPGDALVTISTSGRSTNLIRAAEVARRAQVRVLAITGRAPNPLADRADVAVSIDADATPTVQEIHQVVIHLLCDAVDEALGGSPL
jgi:D-sedoheptulose 7-phosphate isomerase